MPSGDNANPWVVRIARRCDPALRLLCFHHAGGSASLFRAWPDLMPPDIDVWAVQLPGRGARIGEKPIHSMARLIPILIEALVPDAGPPLALFGHSLGAGIAFAMAAALRAAGRDCRHLFVSGRRAPVRPVGTGLHRLDDAGLAAYLRRTGGTPDLVLNEPELMALVLPALRADLALNDGYTAGGVILDVPITAFIGVEDPLVDIGAMTEWSGLTRAPFRLVTMPGGHFYLETTARATAAEVAAELRR
jgi:medium-chain acyl-[acyl-carrier-protein] hydrolase